MSRQVSSTQLGRSSSSGASTGHCAQSKQAPSALYNALDDPEETNGESMIQPGDHAVVAPRSGLGARLLSKGILLRDEVAHTVADPAEVEDEIRYLCAALAAAAE